MAVLVAIIWPHAAHGRRHDRRCVAWSMGYPAARDNKPKRARYGGLRLGGAYARSPGVSVTRSTCGLRGDVW